MQTVGLGGGAGRGSGAQVQLVTKSGSNARHGSLYEFYRTTGGRPAGRVDGEFKGSPFGLAGGRSVEGDFYARSGCRIHLHSQRPTAAKALLQYLASREAEAIWKEAGYEPHR